MDFGYIRHQGLVRTDNEDNFIKLELIHSRDSDSSVLGLYSVADGIGGYENGEYASSLALECMAREFSQTMILPALSGTKLIKDIPFLLSNAVKKANSEINLISNEIKSKMGTTVVAAVLTDDTVYVTNAGDSRCYIQGDQLRQISIDHSVVSDLVASGDLSPEDVYTHPHKNMLTLYIGAQETINVDVFQEKVVSGDSILLCSDGLWGYVRNEKILKIMRTRKSAQSCCDELLKASLYAGGGDNITIMIIRI